MAALWMFERDPEKTILVLWVAIRHFPTRPSRLACFPHHCFSATPLPLLPRLDASAMVSVLDLIVPGAGTIAHALSKILALCI
jgi:hypothetical protein